MLGGYGKLFYSSADERGAKWGAPQVGCEGERDRSRAIPEEKM